MKTALRIAASGLLVGLLFWATDPVAAAARLAGADPVWLALAGLALTAQTVLMAFRWRLTAGRLGLRIGRRRAVGEYYLAQVVNMTLPGGVVGDAARAVRSRDGTGLARAALAVMIERLAGQIALFALAAIGFAAAFATPGGLLWPAGGPVVLAIALGIATLAPLSIRRLAPGVWRPLRRALTARRVWPRQAALGLVIAILNLSAFAACARATGTALGVEAVFTIVPLVLTAMLIPLSVAGWGWREGAAAALFPLAGADPAAGVAASVAFGLVLLAISLPGLLWPILAPARSGALTQGHGPETPVQ
ncbi:MAG: lysylphosphatidylglycerol synthase transmembrane domain-containing protein [Pseudomonadota bacterium]